ncbi:MAG TPA: PilZ domain-containing protein [Candidatus Omnitrophota bacterium]|nr:PilZ domain-containing protein [Candidatus Omnitrophota bacterium]
MSSKERRRSPRIENNIPLKISSEDFDIVTESKNLSCSGAYCTVSQYLEPMTKLKVQLLLPLRRNNKLSTKKVSCSGVVVRTEPYPQQNNFNVAIYFNDVQDRDKKVIAEYISTLLEHQTSS